jgi:hypothetical protein
MRSGEITRSGQMRKPAHIMECSMGDRFAGAKKGSQMLPSVIHALEWLATRDAPLDYQEDVAQVALSTR